MPFSGVAKGPEVYTILSFVLLLPMVSSMVAGWRAARVGFVDAGAAESPLRRDLTPCPPFHRTPTDRKKGKGVSRGEWHLLRLPGHRPDLLGRTPAPPHLPPRWPHAGHTHAGRTERAKAHLSPVSAYSPKAGSIDSAMARSVS